MKDLREILERPFVYQKYTLKKCFVLVEDTVDGTETEVEGGGTSWKPYADIIPCPPSARPPSSAAGVVALAARGVIFPTCTVCVFREETKL
ncbi:hypothetical protein AVEN_203479-1 [Araneus ventricosus]|uniref:Uncharacterized protein n=1 Tax=Araneus ventricosus TaxID=182803 RepID=A0A4Y2BIV6_ARAVE|nr:hypothetical protein AVEN_203479-1 [Araneus ventricosus]